MFLRYFAIICFVSFSFPLLAVKIDTFYGPLEVEEPVLIELIEHPMFQRLKSIHQYGVAYYTTHNEEYSRYDHSIGVFAILRSNHASLTEQIAGLLHDVSHTVFSHVGDWIFGKEYQENDYQTAIHTTFLKQSGLESILNKYGFEGSQILPTEESFPALEQKKPNLCADRIDYNIQGAYYQGFLTYQEAIEIYHHIRYVDGNWILNDLEHLKKLVRFSIFMTQDCWGSATNYFTSRWLADAILRAVEIGSITYDDIHYGTDDIIWKILKESQDSIIQDKMKMMNNPEYYFQFASPEKAELTIFTKFRGIDPWVFSEGCLVRLTFLDPMLADEYQTAKERFSRGWSISMIPSVAMEHSLAL